MAPSLGSLHTLCAIVLIPRPPPMARGAAVAANAQRRAMRSLLQHNSTRMNFQSLFVDAARITKQLLESPVDPLNKWKRTPALAVNSAGFDFDAEDMPRGPSGRRRRKRREEEEEGAYWRPTTSCGNAGPASSPASRTRNASGHAATRQAACSSCKPRLFYTSPALFCRCHAGCWGSPRDDGNSRWRGWGRRRRGGL
ncbi:unnamed protein product [Prorocentrum cordatum]|uniref:Uncharacterized protein n=1 Tax=Prorocentrum cordatum TaxID=2364126 RepID=A0ABN9TNY9_9DINO|nr:unnamed protein product [Polarella glacialis]